ncbi:MAG: septal ring lytic transglycosylase RlpA family protein [Rubrobacteraceae bacterium]|nr:septal ring lytic transglycosylase RlpA family protein [Rubrobacteraceae bacterium]
MLARLSKALWIVVLACAITGLGADRADAREVLASWYGLDFQGEATASGEPYNAYGYTAAHKKLPLGTELVVSYGGRSVRVTVNDRGPYVPGRKLDLSMGAAEYLGLKRVGVDDVKYRRVGGGYDTATHDYGSSGGYATDSSGYSGRRDLSAYSGGESYSTVTQTETSVGGEAYVVQRGDTLSELALQWGTTVEDLAAANGIADPDLIYTGQTLYH